MSLSDTACKNAHKHAKAATGKAFTLFDDKGLHLLIKPLKDSWAKWWRLKYRFNGKDGLLSLGTYPEIGLQQAREKRDDIRKQIADGINPSENRKAVNLAKAESATNSFEVIALEWYERKMTDKSEDHKKRVLGLFNRDLFPYLGSKPIADIKAVELLTALRRIEARNAIETAHRALQVCGQVFRYAIATGRTERDITPDLRGSLTQAKAGHFSAVTEPKEAAELLRAIDGYTGTFVVKSALQLAPLVFVRPGELRAAEWQHINFDAKEWRYFVTKTEVQHIVPLSNQAIAILEEIKPLTGNGRYVFPSARTPNGSRPISDMAMLAALRRMGIGKDEMTVHGFRALARTVLDEVLGIRPDFIEHQLAHAVKDPNGRAYNRTSHLPERHKMMQSWADYLDGLKAGAQVIPFKKTGT